MSEIGVITEQGDLGLGFDPVNETDQETIKKNNDGEPESVPDLT